MHTQAYTTDPALAGFMLTGDSERGVPGLGSHDKENGFGLLWILFESIGQGDTDEQRMISAIARAFLVLLRERREG